VSRLYYLVETMSHHLFSFWGIDIGELMQNGVTPFPSGVTV